MQTVFVFEPVHSRMRDLIRSASARQLVPERQFRSRRRIRVSRAGAPGIPSESNKRACAHTHVAPGEEIRWRAIKTTEAAAKRKTHSNRVIQIDSVAPDPLTQLVVRVKAKPPVQPSVSSSLNQRTFGLRRW